MELQKTFGPIVGMESLVQTRLALTDFVECADGTMIHYGDALEDCKGGYHRNEEDRHEADVEIVRDFLKNVEKWATEYCTEHEDYPGGHAYLVNEVKHEWKARIEEWGCDDGVIEAVCECLDGEFEIEPEYDGNDYARYSGDGCCLYSLKIDESHEQIEVKAHDELKTLHDEDRLDDVLDDLDREFCISRSRRREKNAETGKYEEVGRKTYDRGNGHPTFDVCVGISGQWHYVVPEERMNELVTEAICKLCRRGGK